MRETETSPVFCDTAVKIYLSDWQPSSTWSLKLTLMQYFSDVSVLRWLLNLRSQLQSFCRLSCRETRFAPHLSQNKITFENNANNRAALTRHVKMVRTDHFCCFFQHFCVLSRCEWTPFPRSPSDYHRLGRAGRGATTRSDVFVVTAGREDFRQRRSQTHDFKL